MTETEAGPHVTKAVQDIGRGRPRRFSRHAGIRQGFFEGRSAMLVGPDQDPEFADRQLGHATGLQTLPEPLRVSQVAGLGCEEVLHLLCRGTDEFQEGGGIALAVDAGVAGGEDGFRLGHHGEVEPEREGQSSEWARH